MFLTVSFMVRTMMISSLKMLVLNLLKIHWKDTTAAYLLMGRRELEKHIQ
jgi:hypothetical protein